MRFGDWESGGQIKRALRNNMDGPHFPMNCKRIIHSSRCPAFAPGWLRHPIRLQICGSLWSSR